MKTDNEQSITDCTQTEYIVCTQTEIHSAETDNDINVDITENNDVNNSNISLHENGNGHQLNDYVLSMQHTSINSRQTDENYQNENENEQYTTDDVDDLTYNSVADDTCNSYNFYGQNKRDIVHKDTNASDSCVEYVVNENDLNLQECTHNVKYGHENITLLTWNINGWTVDNKEIRAKVIEAQNADVCILIETHLYDDQKVTVNGYKCFPHNRSLTHVNARRNYGGVCVLVKNMLFNEYNVEVVDKSYDGILALTLLNKNTDYCVLLIAGYLPPERSPWGRDALSFYSHILTLLYQYEYCDNVILTGDLNSRIGSEPDYITGIDDVCNRRVLDKCKNAHGSALIDFLLDAKMCVCNGRFDHQNDNWTCIKWNGTSVVDYFIVTIDCLKKCTAFEIFTAREMINKYCSIDADDINLSYSIPDHSVLLLTVSVLSYEQHKNHTFSGIDQHECNNNVTIDNDNTADVNSANHIYFQRYNVKSVPEHFMNNDVSNTELLDMINQIEQTMAVQEEIDYMYENLCKMYHKEMNLWFKHKNVHPTAKRKQKLSTKLIGNTLALYLSA